MSFRGSTPGATGVPSNEYLNRRAIREGTAKWGDVSQCLGCGMLGHLTYTFTEGAYNHHFQVPFIYDRLHALGRKSVVFGQQAGLGMLNSLPDPSPSKWVKISGSFGLRLLQHPIAKGKAYDAWVKGLALSELRQGPLYQPSADFDVMVLYFGGLDDDVHNGRVKRPGSDEVSDRPSEQYVEEYLDGVIGEVVKEASARLKNSAIYALVADHGHIAVEPTKQMDLDKRGWQARMGPKGLTQWHDVLTPDDSYRVSKTTMVAGKDQPANVVFVPHGGMAHVFVAKDPGGGSQAWVAPPSLERLTPLVNNIRAMTEAWSPATITDVLVRVPGPNGEFAGSEYRVVPRNYLPPACKGGPCEPTASTCGESRDQACTLEAQLLDLSRMKEAPFTSGDAAFDYVDPAPRVAEWASENTGDIVLLANMKEKFFFDKGALASNHGSLTSADAQTPLAFSYPGATSDLEALDTVLDPVRTFLETAPAAGPSARAPVERRAMEAALGLTPCGRDEEWKCEPPPQP